MKLATLNPIRALRSAYSYLTQRIADRRYWLTADSSSGVPVNHSTAMAFTVFARCVAIIAGDISALDLNLKRRRPDGGSELAVGHPDWPLWTLRPAPYLTRQRWIETLMGHVLTRGNAYCEIVRGAGAVGNRPTMLVPIDPTTIEPVGLYQDQVVYRYTPADGRPPAMVTGDRVLHVRGYSEDGLIGIAPLSVIRNSMGLAIGAENYGAALFKNGATPKGVLEYPGVLSDEDFEALRQSFQKNHSGENANRFAILDRGLKWSPTGIAPNDAQFLETRKFQMAEVAGWFGVPMHRLNSLEKATWSNVESLGLDYVRHTLTPWMVRIESEINAAFYPDGELYVEFNFDALTRGDSAARAKYYGEMFRVGGLNLNEIREKEGLNPIGDVGAIHWMPLNMAPAADVLSDPDLRTVGRTSGASAGEGETEGGGEGETDEARAARELSQYLARAICFARLLPQPPAPGPQPPVSSPAARAILADAARRVATKERRAVENAIQRHLARGAGDERGFCDWAQRFYPTQRLYYLTALKPAAELLGFADRLERSADEYFGVGASQISDMLLDTEALKQWAAGRDSAILAHLEPLISQEMA